MSARMSSRFASAERRSDDPRHHDPTSQVKRVCERHGVTWHALRSSSVAAFAAWVSPARGDGAPPVSRFCLRHG